LKVRILGCGTSTGVPKIGNEWGACDPEEPRNARLRSSIIVESGEERLLVDCGPDLRQQLLAARVGTLSAVLVTHDHGDHVHGIDELRPVSQAVGHPIPIYAQPDVLTRLQQRFAFIFEGSSFYPPVLDPREIEPQLALGAMTVRWVAQPHGSITSLGLRVSEGDRSLAYATDFSDLTSDMATLYEGVDVWIADCLTRKPHPTHAHLDAVLGWARDLNVQKLFLTHMGNGMDYQTLVRQLPDWVAPAYDGLEIEL